MFYSCYEIAYGMMVLVMLLLYSNKTYWVLFRSNLRN